MVGFYYIDLLLINKYMSLSLDLGGFYEARHDFLIFVTSGMI